MKKLVLAATVAALVGFSAAPLAAQEDASHPCAALSALKNSGSDASALFSQCLAQSEKVELEPGIYAFERPVVLAKNGVQISTKGRTADSAPCNAQLGVQCAVFVPSPGFSASSNPVPGGAALVRISGKGITLHHIEFDGMASASAQQRGALLAIDSGASDTTILASEFRNWNGDTALSIVRATGVSVMDSRFRSNGSQTAVTSHINVQGGSAVRLTNNFLQNSSKFGISISRCTGCEAQGNVIWQSGSNQARQIVSLRAVGESLIVRNNYVDCSVFGCNAAYFFGKRAESSATAGADISTITARNNFASHALSGFFFGVGTAVEIQDNIALAKAGGFSCGQRVWAPFSKLDGASVASQGRAPHIVDASFSAKALTEQEQLQCVVGTSERTRATGEERTLRSVAQVVFPFLLGRAPTADERSATASQLASGVPLKDLFIGLDLLKRPEPVSGEDVTIMATRGGRASPQGSGTQRADNGEKASSSAVGGPTVTISSATTSLSTDRVTSATITFSRAVTGFVAADITTTNATIQSITPFNGVGSVFTVRFAPGVAPAPVTFAVAANKAAGSANPRLGNQASNTLTLPISFSRPTLSFAPSTYTYADYFSPSREILISFSRAVSTFTAADLACGNCIVKNVRPGPTPLSLLATVQASNLNQVSIGGVTVRVRERSGPEPIVLSNLLTGTTNPLTILPPAGVNLRARTTRIGVQLRSAVVNFSAARLVQCDNCTATQEGSPTNHGNTFFINIKAQRPGQVRVTVLGQSSSWTYAPVAGPIFTSPFLEGNSTLSSSGSPFSIDQLHFGLTLPSTESTNQPTSWDVFAESSASQPTARLETEGDLYGVGYSSGSVFIWPERLLISPQNRFLPCINLRLVPRYADLAIEQTDIYISGCETLIARITTTQRRTSTLQGLFNAPDNAAGLRPINVEYSVVNHSDLEIDIAQQQFPPYTVTALNFNSAGAAQRSFEINGSARCFDVKWRFSFSNGTYSAEERKRFCH